MEDREIFKREMQKLAAAFPHEEIGEVTYQVFWEDLEEFPLDVVLKVLIWARRKLGWFPKIRDVRERAFDLVGSMPTDAPQIEDKREEGPFVDPEEVRRFIASLDQIGGHIRVSSSHLERGSPVLKGKEAKRFEGSRQKAKERAKRMGWGS